MVEEFRDDDTGYLRWVAAHPRGYVLNCHRQPKPTYLMLHRSSCWSVNPASFATRHWTAHYIKVCAETSTEIEAWAESRVGASPTGCSFCHL